MDIIHKKIEAIKRFYEKVFETTVAIPVALIILSVGANGLLQADIKKTLSGDSSVKTENGGFLALAHGEALLSNEAPHTEEELINDDENPGAIIIDDSAFLNTGNPQSSVILNRDGLIVYKVQKGDTLSGVAANFGVSLNTVMWANKDLKGNSLRIGQEILILPVSGIIHQTQSGETLESISSFYGISESRIIKYNQRVLSQGLAQGTNLIIPDVKPKSGTGGSIASKLPDFPGYYALPTTGWNWGRIHNNNAVDIANACGTPIYASAEGLVTEVKPLGWNEGYGNYIIIEHPNNTKTRYAHNQKNVASLGDYVLQGDIIAYIGNTGLTHGPTGCHVHFEIVGARNPFAK